MLFALIFLRKLICAVARIVCDSGPTCLPLLGRGGFQITTHPFLFITIVSGSEYRFSQYSVQHFIICGSSVSVHPSLSLTSFTVGHACFVKLFTAANMPFESFRTAPSPHTLPPSDSFCLYVASYVPAVWTVCTDQSFQNSRASWSERVFREWSMPVWVVCISHSTFLWRTQVSTPSGTIIIVWCPIAIRFHCLQVQLEAGTCYWAPADTDRSAHFAWSCSVYDSWVSSLT